MSLRGARPTAYTEKEGGCTRHRRAIDYLRDHFTPSLALIVELTPAVRSGFGLSPVARAESGRLTDARPPSASDALEEISLLAFCRINRSMLAGSEGKESGGRSLSEARHGRVAVEVRERRCCGQVWGNRWTRERKPSAAFW